MRLLALLLASACCAAADKASICGQLLAAGGPCHHHRGAQHQPPRFASLRRRETPKGPSHNTPAETPNGYYPADDKMRGDYVAAVKPKKPGNPPPPAPDGTFVPDGMCDWCWNDHN